MTDAPPAGTSLSLAALGEWELIRRLARFAPPGQFKDDAAVLEHDASAGALVVNTDVLVEGVHFSERTTGPWDVGWRAAAANLSDLAAMGCTTVVGLTVGLVAPATTPWSWVEGVYAGLTGCLSRLGGVLLGGDCSSGRERLLAITALGRLPAVDATTPEDGPATTGPIRRADGRPGDWLVSSGPHGLSRLGLALLQGELGEAPTAELARRAIAAHRRPQPRFDVVRALIDCRPADLPWRVGGCDSSDGLAAAVTAIASCSGCNAYLDRDALPLETGMADLHEAEAWCLAGGEDFELVLALAPPWASALCQALRGCRVVGVLEAGQADGLRWTDGGIVAPQLGGYRHFG
ncbi:MAG: thiamine-phosphate kinase [Synechococcaceae cyanobacterium]|nr:thiamine-phosphate kinase [Synechococcaceae cyanobacterium]